MTTVRSSTSRRLDVSHLLNAPAAWLSARRGQPQEEDGKMRFEGPDYSKMLALTGFILSAAFIVSIIAK
jgi:hypothetical protein